MKDFERIIKKTKKQSSSPQRCTENVLFICLKSLTGILASTQVVYIPPFLLTLKDLELESVLYST